MGFNRPSILTSFVIESLLLSLLGGAVAVMLMLPFNGLTTGTSNMMTFSEVVFQMRITPTDRHRGNSVFGVHGIDWWAGSRLACFAAEHSCRTERLGNVYGN